MLGKNIRRILTTIDRPELEMAEATDADHEID